MVGVSLMKKYVKVAINEEIDRKFREFLIKKYGIFKKGMYKKELEQAILEYIERKSG